ncbi:hypothetical protein SFMTTN_1521 [Sulfuriferula multivorans]|uniref:Uncharacterized protein n=1 Tax=Sulfuriferula multivorans TaxID=1559896 RepID=A0A401JDS6_9PROT|nr:hypothetical protein [Sulfuriferula multivorans]GBL45710.1 hypothetical protein SFMTTN_1521 [Sulfuriferula multivorans]
MIAIDTDRRLFYEGSSNYGHGIWPSPFVSIATVLPLEMDLSAMPTSSSDLGHAKLIFREDTFDPVTRVRRGRFYFNLGFQPQEWHVQTHPAFKEEVGNRDHQGNLIKRLYGFQRWPAFTELHPEKTSPLVALGTADAFTLWKVIGIERIVTGEDLVTLRARSAMGVLPEIQMDLVPTEGREKVMQTIEKVVEAAYRAGPESVIDRCRDAAQASLGVWMADKFSDDGLRRIDLGPQIKALEKRMAEDLPVIVVSVGKAIARLHARCKPNEQLTREGRLLIEDDAESAIAMLGLLYREFRWCQS